MAKLMQTTAAPKQEQWQQGDIVQDDKGNRLQLSGDRWLPIEAPLTEEQVALSQIGPVEAFVRAAYERGAQLVGGGMQLAQDPRGPKMITESQARMRGIEEGNPNAAWAGGMAPDVLGGLGVAALTGGAGIPAILGAEAAYGAGMGALSQPNNPLEGAGVGAGLGVLGVGAGAVAGAALRRTGITDRVMSALGKADEATRPRGAIGAERIMRPTEAMVDFVADAEALGLRVPASVRRESQFLENVGLTLESSPLTSWAVPNVAAHNQQVLSRIVKQATGIADDAALTPQTIRAAEKETGRAFRTLADFGTTELGKLDARTVIESAIPESFVGRSGFLKKVDRLLGDQADVMNTDRLMSLQSSLGDLARKAKGETRLAISDAREAIINAIPANKGQEQAFAIAREQWAAQRALLDSIGQRGQVSAARLARRLNANSTGDTPISRLARAAEVINYMRPTAYGTENARRGGLTGTVLTGGALGGAAGYVGGLFQ